MVKKALHLGKIENLNILETTRIRVVKRNIVNLLVATFFGILGVLTNLLFFTNKKPSPEIEYSSQIKRLDDIGKNLTSLQEFIKSQKSKLIESEKTLSELKEEESRIRPVVETDKKTIEAILMLQSKTSEKNIWKERVFAFFLGVFSSLFATLLLDSLKKKRTESRKK